MKEQLNTYVYTFEKDDTTGDYYLTSFNKLNDTEKSISMSEKNIEKAKKEIKRIDKQRANHYKHYTGKEWKDSDNYDICINSDTFGVEKSAEIICDMLKSKTRV